MFNDRTFDRENLRFYGISALFTILFWGALYVGGSYVLKIFGY